MKLISTIIIIGIITMSTTQANLNYKAPVFLIDYTIYGTGAEIRLNDIPVVYSTSQGKTQSTKPVPESIVNGINSLQVKAFTTSKSNNTFEQDAYIIATLKINEESAPLSKASPLLSLHITPTSTRILEETTSYKGNSDPVIITQSSEQVTVIRESNIDSPFPKWEWEDGITITNTQDNYNTLLNEYKNIYDALSNKDIDKVYDLYDRAAEEFATAYNMNNKQGGHEIISTGELMNDTDWKLGDIDVILSKREYKLDIFANGKLARIVDNYNKESLITYLNPSNRLTSFQKFSFYKNKNNEWVMIR